MLKLIGVGDNIVDCHLHTGIMYPGGNSVNFAVYGRQLGHQAAYMGTLGNDVYAKLLTDAFDATGVEYSLCEVVNDETGRTRIDLVDGDRTITDENEYGCVKTHPFQVTPQRLEYIKGFDVAHSSIYSFVEGYLGDIKALGVPLVYDFSDIWEEKHFDEVCPNINIAFFSGKKLPDSTLHDLLAHSIDLGCELAITTVGKRGAIVFDGRRYHTKIPYNLDAKVVDTLGAGDSFLTGFITTYIEGKKRFARMVGENPGLYTTGADRREYTDTLIESAMSAGNLLAIRNCFVYGAFGHGAKLPG